MYFILSKVLYFIILPLNWVITLLLIAALTRRRKLRKWTAWIGCILLIIFSCPYLFLLVAWHWDMHRVDLPAGKKYSSVIVLGGFTSSDDQQNGFFNGSADRFIQGLRLYDTGSAAHILITGGNGMLLHGNYSEGEWTKQQLLQFHVPDSAMLIEGKSRNTYENALYSKKILEQSGLKPPFLLVTSAFHMRRAQMIFRNQGIDVVPYPSNFYIGGDAFSWDKLIPDFNVITYWPTYMKEITGYLVNSKM